MRDAVVFLGTGLTATQQYFTLPEQAFVCTRTKRVAGFGCVFLL